MEMKISGIHFLPRETKLFISNLKKGHPLKFTPDPDNEYDNNAIKIVALNEDAEEVFIGFVPKEHNVELLKKINCKKKMIATYAEKQKFNLVEEGEQVTLLGMVF